MKKNNNMMQSNKDEQKPLGSQATTDASPGASVLSKLMGVEIDPRQYRRVLLVSLVLLFFASAGIATAAAIGHQPYVAIPVGIVSGILLVAFLLAWMGRLVFPGVFVPFVALIVVNYINITGDGLHDIGFFALPLVVILASQLLGRRGTVVFTIFAISTIVGVGLAEMAGYVGNDYGWPVNSTDLIIVSVISMGTGGILFVLQDTLVINLRRARASELVLAQSNRELRILQEGLEQRVKQRTADLLLSAEVGQALSQERDLDHLLRAAVDLIQSRFDLYYTQIYLADSAGRVLTLQSGSGEVGEELLRRGHRLPVGLGSINGRAAANRQPVVVQDTVTSPFFRPNPLLPQTRSEMAVPLLVGERVVGVLDVQSNRPEALTEDHIPAFEALAGQLAIAIQNAALFNETQQARAELERQARRETRAGWRNFLDAIERSERIGFSMEGDEVAGLVSPISTLQEGNRLSADIDVIGERIGVIQLERDKERSWTQDDSELVSAVAGQVARQLENLRLLAQAERYRQEAEYAARKLTRQGWEEYLQEMPEIEIGFDYDRTHVTLIGDEMSEVGHEYKSESAKVDEAMDVELATKRFTQQLNVRDVMVGELVIEVDRDLDDNERALVNTVSERLGDHLESLRLAGQTQAALASTETLYTGSEQVVRSATASEVLKAVITSTALEKFDRGSIMLFNETLEGSLPESGTLAGVWERVNETPTMPVENRVPLPRIAPVVPMLQRGEPLFLRDIHTDERLDPQTRAVLSRLGNTLALFPMFVGESWFGWLSVFADAPVDISDEQVRQVQSLVGQASAVVQSIRLLEQSQARARREQVLREVTERVRSGMNSDTVLRTAVRELGNVLGRNVLIRLGDPLGGKEGE